MIGLLACAPAPPTPEGPDVLVVTVDTLRADRLGFAGFASARTPALDALAAQGTVFEQATTPFPRTTPALGSLHTGLLPVRHGSREVGDPVDADERLAGWLRDAGWQTAAVSAMRVAGPDQRMDLGFDAFVVAHDAPAHEITSRALTAAAGFAPDRPAFLWVHYADPHFPYLPDAPIEAPRCRAIGERAFAGKLARAPLYADRGGEARAILEECRALYDGEVAQVDEAVGALLAGLAAARPRSRLVVFTADHGENLGEGGLYYEHGPDLSDASVRVPLIVAGPGFGGRDRGVARLEDLAPTVFSALDLPVPPGLDGVPLQGPRTAPALVESGSALQVPLHRWLVSGRGERWCLNEGPFSWCSFPARPAGLFRPAEDPELRRELSAVHPEVALRLRAAADRWKPEQAHLRAARTPEGTLLEVPTVDGWRIEAVGTPDDAAGTALAGFSARLSTADGPGGGDAEALRALGYVE